MTIEEAIKYLKQLYPNGGHCWLDEQRIEAIGMAIAALEHEKPVSEDLEEALEQLAENARKHKAETSSPFFSPTDYKQGVKDGAKWQENRLLPMIDKICGICQKQQDFINSKDLGELISTLSRRYPEVSFAKLSRIAVRAAKWQKEQMMKDAIGLKINRDTLYDLKPIIHERYLDYKIGDKIKVIIVRED